MLKQGIFEALEMQRAIVHEIFAVTRDQVRALDSEDYERLHALLETRQDALNRLGSLKFSPADSVCATVADQQRLTELRGEIEQLLREILVMDQAARARIECHQDELRRAIQEIRRGRQGLAGYRQALESAPQIVDHAQ